MAKSRVYVSRETQDTKDYSMWLKKPCLDAFGWFESETNGDFLGEFCATHFERITGIKLKPGECKRFTLTIEAKQG